MGRAGELAGLYPCHGQHGSQQVTPVSADRIWQLSSTDLPEMASVHHGLIWQL